MERPAKRVRQACDPCRRKKSKCPGEKPVCSYCSRLGQECSYTDEPVQSRHTVSVAGIPSTPPQSIERATIPLSATFDSTDTTSTSTTARLNVVETQLAEVLSVLNHQRERHNSHGPSTQSQYEPPRATQDGGENSILENLPSEVPHNATALYLEYCHCQPLPLLAPYTFAPNAPPKDSELTFAMAALSLRFDTSLKQEEQNNLARQYSEAAAALVMRRIASGTIELSTLQTLCLLVLVNFYNSDTQKASTYLSLAVDLSQNAGLSWSCKSPTDSPTQDAQMRCFWSILLLVRMHANLLGPFCFSVDTSSLIVYPSSISRPSSTNADNAGLINDSRQSSDYKDLGINAYVIQLAEVWQSVAQYARRRRQPEAHPPWSTKSGYAKILSKQMEGETLMPYNQHRYKPANFADRTLDELDEYRQYWAPWLLTQMMYHGIICLLNHPLLLSLRLRSFRIATIPEIWLQHTDDLVSSHTRWIIHLIELIESKGFLVADPFLAHLAAIVATIYLQQSFVEDVEVQQTKKDGYLTCLRFCQQIGKQWRHVENLVEKLETLERIVSISFQNSASSSSRDKVYIDLTTFWEILESALISESPDQHGLRFGSSLKPHHHAHGNAEEVSAHPLPEPSRLNSVSIPWMANARRNAAYDPQAGTGFAPVEGQGVTNDDFAVLAQSYFAQGQDFVGGLDDWWTLSQL